MDHYSILDQSAPAQPAAGAPPPPPEPARPAMSVSAAIAAANARAGSVLGGAERGLRFPAEDYGRSLAEMAESDLDAVLQLLADRAQYITGATGAAVALRRKNQNDMQCRASAGSNAPELGTLLSAEFGLSGESVRTRSPLRCDDTERDPRVNREGCRELGIASVVVMPIVSEDKVLGVFELFSGQVNAFTERDMSALHRLGEMVQTAVAMAEAAKGVPEELIPTEISDSEDLLTCEIVDVTEPVVEVEVAGPAGGKGAAIPPVAEATSPAMTVAAEAKPQTDAPKKPVMWTAALQTAAVSAEKPSEADQSHVPPVLRNLKKCHACGFPITEGRLLCVECEEKKWRGQLRSSMAASGKAAPAPVPAIPVEKVIPAVVPAGPPRTLAEAMAAVSASAAATAPVKASQVAPAPVSAPETKGPVANGADAQPSAPVAPATVKTESPKSQPPTPEFSSLSGAANLPDVPILSAGIASSESWLSANKYIVGAILVVAAAVAGIVLLR